MTFFLFAYKNSLPSSRLDFDMILIIAASHRSADRNEERTPYR